MKRRLRTGQNGNQVQSSFTTANQTVGLFSGSAVGNHKGPMKLQACLYSAGDGDANVVGSRHVCSPVPRRRQLTNASFVVAAAAKPICIVFSLLMRQPQTTDAIQVCTQWLVPALYILRACIRLSSSPHYATHQLSVLNIKRSKNEKSLHCIIIVSFIPNIILTVTSTHHRWLAFEHCLQAASMPGQLLCRTLGRHLVLGYMAQHSLAHLRSIQIQDFCAQHLYVGSPPHK